MEDYLLMMVGAIFVNNILLIRFLGNCPFLGVSNAMSSALGMSAAVIFVNTLAGTICWVLQKVALEPLNIEYLQTLVFILVIAALVQFVEIIMQKVSPPLYRALGIYLPLITTNCMIFGVAVLNIKEDYNFMQALVYSISTAVGFSMAVILLAGIRERMAAAARIPKLLDGVPIGLITAGMMGLSFAGLLGLAK